MHLSIYRTSWVIPVKSNCGHFLRALTSPSTEGIYIYTSLFLLGQSRYHQLTSNVLGSKAESRLSIHSFWFIIDKTYRTKPSFWVRKCVPVCHSWNCAVNATHPTWNISIHLRAASCMSCIAHVHRSPFITSIKTGYCSHSFHIALRTVHESLYE